MSDLCQYPTPLWVAEAIVERYFRWLDCADMVLEPSCGRGAFLKAIPVTIPAAGVEIDPAEAAIAKRETGREVIVGDFRTVELDIRPTAIIGNPPFRAKLFDGFLDRAYELLPAGGQAGFILPNYMFQTARRVTRYFERWSIKQEMLPRHAFSNRMQTPLIFALFSKSSERVLVGFALYVEHADVMTLDDEYREALQTSTGSAWRTVCRIALERLGGQADLAEIYRELERNRPTKNPFWRDKIRQTLRAYSREFVPLKVGRYALRMEVAA